jgi:hypothetical protein
MDVSRTLTRFPYLVSSLILTRSHVVDNSGTLTRSFGLVDYVSMTHSTTTGVCYSLAHLLLGGDFVPLARCGV